MKVALQKSSGGKITSINPLFKRISRQAVKIIYEVISGKSSLYYCFCVNRSAITGVARSFLLARGEYKAGPYFRDDRPPASISCRDPS